MLILVIVFVTAVLLGTAFALGFKFGWLLRPVSTETHIAKPLPPRDFEKLKIACESFKPDGRLIPTHGVWDETSKECSAIGIDAWCNYYQGTYVDHNCRWGGTCVSMLVPDVCKF